MNKSLIENSYIIIPEFLSSTKSKQLSDEFVDYVKTNNLSGDAQVPTSASKYNYTSFLELLCEKTPDISKIIGETVLPTYTYSRVYYSGSVLSPHTDRKECEISITVNLDCDTPWDIWIRTPQKENKRVTLHPGDAMLYLGCDAIHWREKFEGQFCTQVFLHYVRSRGPYGSKYFDKKVYHEFTDSGEEVVKTPTLVVKNEMNYSSKKTLDEYIKVYDSVLTDSECDLIINEYSKSNEWNSSRTGAGEVNKNIRNCDIIGISLPDVINLNPQIRKQIDQIIFDGSDKIVKNYIEEFTDCQLISDSGYDLLRYYEGGYYKTHTDSYKQSPRTISCSFNLNDDYEGGEFSFFNGEMMVKLSKGSAIIFPSNFMYPHEILEVKKGIRYSIVTWFT